MSLINHSWHWQPSGDDSHDGHYPAGDKTPNLVWNLAGAPSLANLTSGTPYSSNFKQFLTTPNPASTAVSVINVSGDNAITEGWAISPDQFGDNLTNDGTHSTGVGQFKVRANYLSFIADSPIIPWSYVSSVVSIRFNPGHYFMVAGNDTFSTSKLDLAQNKLFKGAVLRMHPNTLESTKGNFLTGAGSAIKAFVDACTTRSLKAIVIVLHKEGTTNPASIFPAYYATEDAGAPIYYTTPGPPAQVCMRLDRAVSMSRLIAMNNAILDAFNNNTTFEALISPADTSMPNPQPGDWSTAGHLAQMQRIPVECVTHASKCNLLIGADYMSGTRMEQLIASAAATRTGVFGIDVMTSNVVCNSHAFHVCKGNHQDGTAGGIDYRDVIPIAGHVSGPGCGGKEGTRSAQQFRDQAFTGGLNYLIWNDNASNRSAAYGGITQLYMVNPGGGTPYYPTDISTWVHDTGPTNPMHATCVSTYGGSCTP